MTTNCMISAVINAPTPAHSFINQLSTAHIMIKIARDIITLIQFTFSALSKKTRHNAYGKYEKNAPKNKYLIPYKIHINRLSLKA